MNLLVDRKLGKTILHLAYPITIAMLTQTAITLADTMMVGRLSTEWSIAGQSAIGISLILLWASGGLIASIGVGTQAIAARRFGAGEFKKAGQVLDNAVLIALVLSIAATIAIISTLPDFFPYLHSNPRVIELGLEYCTYRMYGMGSMALTIVFKGFFDGIGRTKVHMTAAILMNIVNIALNYSLIFGVGPFPQMHVAGAGLASLIATFVGLIVMVYFAAEKGNRKKFSLFHLSSFDFKVGWNVVKLGLPGGMATVFVMTGFGAFITIVSWLDADIIRAAVAQAPAFDSISVGAFVAKPSEIWNASLYEQIYKDNPPIYTAATKVIMDAMQVIFMTAIAFGQATATLVSQSMGSGNPDQAERYGWESVKLGIYILGSVGLFMVLFPDMVSGAFNPDKSVIAAGHTSLMLMGAGSIFIAAGMILSQALFGAGHTMFVMVAEAILHFFCLIPVAYLFGVYWSGGMVGIWSAALLYVALLAVVMVIKFYRGGWKTTQI
ncbi:MAG TPA: MATE family efflux transporter [Myxococcales bacterium]|nr:MATE family efflux transporter [Myxococcales bacterium]HIN86891.1 MATE family efflux transporter [Myxococcales bacterium]